jgi:hypothetical protein
MIKYYDILINGRWTLDVPEWSLEEYDYEDIRPAFIEEKPIPALLKKKC